MIHLIAFARKTKQFIISLFTTLLSILIFSISNSAVAQNADVVVGSGSTFVYPLIAKWADTYQQKNKVNINYQSVGSSAGVKSIKTKVVDFAASDKPLTPQELRKHDLLQFPITIGGVVPVYNLEGVSSGTLKLTGSVLADIFLGKIIKWNDPLLVALNPTIKLPNRDIIPVHRADGSGTTYLFTHYLDKVSSQWHQEIGVGSSIKWTGGIGGKGNEGVATMVQRLSGTIGYVEYGYAKKNNIPLIQLKNKDGYFVLPQDDAFQSAADQVDWSKHLDFYNVLTEQSGKITWPITGASFILIHQKPQNQAVYTERTKNLYDFLHWSLTTQQKETQALYYVPLSNNLIRQIKNYWIRYVQSNLLPNVLFEAKEVNKKTKTK